MNHKTLLALFLFFIIICSPIISNASKLGGSKIVSNDFDDIVIQNIVDDSPEIKYDIYYPETKYENINREIIKKINEYKEKKYKKLDISFERYNTNEFETFKFNVNIKNNSEHDKKEVFTIVHRENEIIQINDVVNVDKLSEECILKIKENDSFKKYSNDDWLKNIEGIYDNFAYIDNKIILFVNPNIIAPEVAGIIQIEIDNEVGEEYEKSN